MLELAFLFSVTKYATFTVQSLFEKETDEDEVVVTENENFKFSYNGNLSFIVFIFIMTMASISYKLANLDYNGYSMVDLWLKPYLLIKIISVIASNNIPDKIRYFIYMLYNLYVYLVLTNVIEQLF